MEGLRQNLQEQGSSKALENQRPHATELGRVFLVLLRSALWGPPYTTCHFSLPIRHEGRSPGEGLLQITVLPLKWTSYPKPSQFSWQVDNPSYSASLSLNLSFIKKKHAMDARYFLLSTKVSLSRTTDLALKNSFLC